MLLKFKMVSLLLLGGLLVLPLPASAGFWSDLKKDSKQTAGVVKETGQKAGSKLKEDAAETGYVVREGASKAGGKLKEAGRDVGKGVKEAWKKVKDAVK